MLVTIEKLIYGGEGLAHDSGSAVFVPFVLPGEKVDASSTERKKKFVRAKLDRVVEPSRERIPAPCPHFGVCGGCDYQHIPYEGQLEYKIEILRETLRRLGRIEWTGEIKAHASPPWNYRNRAQWKVRPAASGSKGDANAPDGGARPGSLGGRSFAPPKTTCAKRVPLAVTFPRVVQARTPRPTTRHRLFSREFDGALPRYRMRDTLAPARKNFTGFARSGGTRRIPKNVARDRRLPSTRATRKCCSQRHLPDSLPARRNSRRRSGKSLRKSKACSFSIPGRERMELYGPGFIEYETVGTEIPRRPLFVFSGEPVPRGGSGAGSNRGDEAASRSAAALRWICSQAWGFFRCRWRKQFDRVIAVESNPAAARDLEGELRGAGRSKCAPRTWSASSEKCKEKPEFVVLDPPRAGMEPGAAKPDLANAPARITYVSCEPPTLARDLAVLRDGGYEISDIHLFDLFPQTFHMETVVRLRRRQ